MNQTFINDLAERVLKSASLKPVGETWISFDGTIPFGGIPFLGGSYSKELYKDLYAYAKAKGRVITEEEWQKKNKEQNGNVPFYSDVSSTEFRVPRINGYFKGSDSVGETGMYIKEGIPNFTGYFDTRWGGTLETDTGCFTGKSEWSSRWGGNTDGAGSYNTRHVIDPSKANPIYGASEHVTPETIQVLVGVYAFGTVSNIGNADVGKLVTEVGNLTNKINAIKEPSTYIVETWKDGNNWFTLYSDGLCEQGGFIRGDGYSSPKIVSLNKPFINTTYTLVASPVAQDNNAFAYTAYTSGRTKQNFKLITGINGDRTGTIDTCWFAHGYYK